MSDSDIDRIKKALKGRKKAKPSSFGLSTGSTLLNLACTNKPDIGFKQNHYYFLVGDSSSGKTFLSLTCLAEASINKAFDNYRFIFDDAEDGALMDKTKFFGKGVTSRLEPPAVKDGQPVFSTTIEDFYFHVDDAIKDGRPFIYILDSMDSLDTEDDRDKFDKRKLSRDTGKDVSGSYGTSKAKANSNYLRRIVSALKKTGSILIIISQTRDNIGFGAQFNPKTRSGGKALRFYATLEIWTSVREKIKKNVRGKQREIGIVSQLRVKKNRQTGREPIVEVNIYHSVGIDDIGSCVAFLIDEKHWKVKDKKINAEELGVAATEENLIRYIEENNLETDLHSIVAKVWGDIEAGCEVKRKKRYG